MKKSSKWLQCILYIAIFLAFFCLIYRIYLDKHLGNRVNAQYDLEQLREYRFRSVELALEAFLANSENRTNDFESIIENNLFDNSLREIIRYLQSNNDVSGVANYLTTYIYMFVINLAGDPTPIDWVYDKRTIEVFRRIQHCTFNLSAQKNDTEIETLVTSFIEQAIRKYDTHLNKISLSKRTNDECAAPN